MLSFCDKEKYSLKISASKTPLKNMFQKSFPAISHDYFLDQKNSCAISYNYCPIQIEG